MSRKKAHDLKSPRFAGDPVLEACYDNERLLRVGDRGPAVQKIQQALIDAGFPLPRFGADGVFGAETKAAVRNYQRAHGLAVDGIVGPTTMGCLDAQFASTPPAPLKKARFRDTFCPVNNASDASSANFSLSEFRCHDGTDVPEKFRGNVQQVMDNLEVLRTELGNKSITIISGYRTPAYNQSKRGAPQSRHMCGQAADIRVSDHTPTQVADAIETLITSGRMRQGGLGRYSAFVHYDVRGTRARW